jgi:hypothetical protein
MGLATILDQKIIGRYQSLAALGISLQSTLFPVWFLGFDSGS